MCLAIPAQIVEIIDENSAKVALGSVTKEVTVTLIEEPQVGEYILIHAGFALNRIDPEEAQKTLELFDSIDLTEHLGKLA
ncbi:HypC/HybG/HupF family hydrogenase formation chaperone [Dongshaea marina]|uniref:HypC/HybG/HupF family hydrogenase formation chaperone n=1 Tax=Dongshaea marina TaxID=2047966 RepID=UPI000D3EBF7D|nr:HypC/HybG/HupF family hydrogenase formation chaperone [Dongshaea marina]